MTTMSSLALFCAAFAFITPSLTGVDNMHVNIHELNTRGKYSSTYLLVRFDFFWRADFNQTKVFSLTALSLSWINLLSQVFGFHKRDSSQSEPALTGQLYWRLPHTHPSQLGLGLPLTACVKRATLESADAHQNHSGMFGMCFKARERRARRSTVTSFGFVLFPSISKSASMKWGENYFSQLTQTYLAGVIYYFLVEVPYSKSNRRPWQVTLELHKNNVTILHSSAEVRFEPTFTLNIWSLFTY